ncbi:hypothetical protein H9Q70_005024 [Fusarium xylarioides]|nr:hypothetical protein H9Q70_005024 [Fusarium xylarioides]KAG5783913.1 hypothetical protein H9Q73_002413 [Fusarium xylarioides]
MTSREAKERALNRIEELEAELRETKARHAALETKAKHDAKKLADISCTIQSGMPGNHGDSDADTRRFESLAVATALLDNNEEFEATTIPNEPMADSDEEIKPLNIFSA